MGKILSEAQLAQRRAAASRGGRARADNGDPVQEARLADVQSDPGSVSLDAPGPDPDPAEAVFLGVVKRADLSSTGGWIVRMEIPSSDTDAFFPVAASVGLELVCHVIRKPTSRPRQPNGARPRTSPAA